MFCVDVRRMNQNKPVILSTWDYDYTPAIDLHETEIYWAIKDYLVKKGDSETEYHAGSKTFVGMRVYLLDEKVRNKEYFVYAWVRESKYYLENEELKEDSASSIPYKFVVKKNSNGYYVSDFKMPRDGNLYQKDMKNIFPYWVRQDMKSVDTDGTKQKLSLEIEEQAKLYFHK